LPSRTSLVNSSAKTGSIPEEQSAIMEMEPVGAMVVMVAFLNPVPLSAG